MSNTITNDIEIIEDDAFSYEGYQVVRGEFFAHVYEPSFTFNNYKVSVNTACIKKLPEFDYVQILVNPDDKKLAVRPCREDEKDSFRWCSATAKRSPKQITCRMFFAKVLSLMEWNPNYRYKLLGKLVHSGDELLFIFDLNSPEIYKRTLKEDGKTTTSRTPAYPEDWKNQFGVPVEEHRAAMQINLFNGYAVFGLEEETSTPNTSEPVITIKESEEPAHEQSYEQLSITASISGDRPQEKPYSYSQENPTPFGRS